MFAESKLKIHSVPIFLTIYLTQKTFWTENLGACSFIENEHKTVQTYLRRIYFNVLTLINNIVSILQASTGMDGRSTLPFPF